MATVDSKDLVDQLIAADGYYMNDPRLVKIVEYTNAYGGVTWGLVYPDDDPNRYRETEYVRNPHTIWAAQ